jgi:hypothetical protein
MPEKEHKAEETQERHALHELQQFSRIEIPSYLKTPPEVAHHSSRFDLHPIVV